VKINSRTEVLVITERVELGQSIQRLLTQHFAKGVTVFSFTFAESQMFLTPRRIDETGLFVLDLLRPYPGGLRAEGLVLADRLRWRAPSLLVSPLYLSEGLECMAYWDTSCEDTLAARAERLLSGSESSMEGFDRIVDCFERMLRIPRQHETFV
jgi:hypothetical protein